LAQDEKRFRTHLACMQYGDSLKRKMVEDFVAITDVKIVLIKK